ncbi:MAG: IS630 family transposase [Ilumatobacter sp.]|uniref:IS630 family transposase n=1 Tax=Ilumatobacter sp. TaxID=1967498 RepID=UPI00262C2E0B|nr:IS630 family transposase [Ilumatobacter sp.]MDJ0770588.1 IS630 family transposase [Ilumatobacter sp.]
MTKPVRVRRLNDAEGRQLQQIVRRGGKSDRSIVKWRRAMVVLASAGGNDVATIARLVQTSPDRVREMIHRFNDLGMRSLDPQWAGGRPRLITTTDRKLIVETATTRPTKLGCPFSHWSIRKLADHLATRKGRQVRIGRERLRQILIAEGITFQRTKTWKESPDPLKEQKLARIEYLLEHQRDRTFAFDEFGPLTIRPVAGAAWAPRGRPVRLRANYHKPHGSRQLYACYSIGDDHLWGEIEPQKGSAATLRAIQSIRARLDDGRPIHVILDNLNHHKNRDVRAWCDANSVELVFTPTYASWANPIEAHFGPLRQFVIANSDHADHATLADAITNYLDWRNTHTRDPRILDAERRHRARTRSEHQRRWGHPRRAA